MRRSVGELRCGRQGWRRGRTAMRPMRRAARPVALLGLALTLFLASGAPLRAQTFIPARCPVRPNPRHGRDAAAADSPRGLPPRPRGGSYASIVGRTLKRRAVTSPLLGHRGRLALALLL